MLVRNIAAERGVMEKEEKFDKEGAERILGMLSGGYKEWAEDSEFGKALRGFMEGVV